MEQNSLALEMLKELKHQSRRWFIIAIIELILIIATNTGWLIYEGQFETISEESITQEQNETENSNMTGVIN